VHYRRGFGRARALPRCRLPSVATRGGGMVIGGGVIVVAVIVFVVLVMRIVGNK
jgi:hypothetical protein